MEDSDLEGRIKESRVLISIQDILVLDEVTNVLNKLSPNNQNFRQVEGTTSEERYNAFVGEILEEEYDMLILDEQIFGLFHDKLTETYSAFLDDTKKLGSTEKFNFDLKGFLDENPVLQDKLQQIDETTGFAYFLKFLEYTNEKDPHSEEAKLFQINKTLSWIPTIVFSDGISQQRRVGYEDRGAYKVISSPSDFETDIASAFEMKFSIGALIKKLGLPNDLIRDNLIRQAHTYKWVVGEKKVISMFEAIHTVVKAMNSQDLDVISTNVKEREMDKKMLDYYFLIHEATKRLDRFRNGKEPQDIYSALELSFTAVTTAKNFLSRVQIEESTTHFLRIYKDFHDYFLLNEERIPFVTTQIPKIQKYLHILRPCRERTTNKVYWAAGLPLEPVFKVFMRSWNSAEREAKISDALRQNGINAAEVINLGKGDAFSYAEIERIKGPRYFDLLKEISHLPPAKKTPRIAFLEEMLVLYQVLSSNKVTHTLQESGFTAVHDIPFELDPHLSLVDQLGMPYSSSEQATLASQLTQIVQQLNGTERVIRRDAVSKHYRIQTEKDYHGVMQVMDFLASNGFDFNDRAKSLKTLKDVTWEYDWDKCNLGTCPGYNVAESLFYPFANLSARKREAVYALSLLNLLVLNKKLTEAEFRNMLSHDLMNEGYREALEKEAKKVDPAFSEQYLGITSPLCIYYLLREGINRWEQKVWDGEIYPMRPEENKATYQESMRWGLSQLRKALPFYTEQHSMLARFTKDLIKKFESESKQN